MRISRDEVHKLCQKWRTGHHRLNVVCRSKGVSLAVNLAGVVVDVTADTITIARDDGTAFDLALSDAESFEYTDAGAAGGEGLRLQDESSVEGCLIVRSEGGAWTCAIFELQTRLAAHG